MPFLGRQEIGEKRGGAFAAQESDALDHLGQVSFADIRLDSVVHGGGFPVTRTLFELGMVRGIEFPGGLRTDQERFAGPIHLRDPGGDGGSQPGFVDTGRSVERDADRASGE